MIRLEPGDCLKVIPRLVGEGVVCDACVTDPPYHLQSGNASVDWSASKTEKGITNKLGRAHKTGFMSSRWDGGDIAFCPETWVTIKTILRPGGFLLSFGGTRTFHRMVCAIEDAGFVIQDSIIDMIASDARWSAFLDSLNDEQRAALGNCLDDIGFGGLLAFIFGTGFPKNKMLLKPAFEPVCVAYKPGGKRTLQVDECRIAADWINDPSKRGLGYGHMRAGSGTHAFFGSVIENLGYDTTKGRWPANVVLGDGSNEVMEAFAAFGDRSSGVPSNGRSATTTNVYSAFSQRSLVGGGDTGSASRFYYCAKADNAHDRFGSKHPTVKPVELIKWLIKLVTPKDGLCLDPFAGSGTTGVAAMATGRNVILIEKDETYCGDIRERIAFYEGIGSHSLVSKARNRSSATTGTLL